MRLQADAVMAKADEARGAGGEVPALAAAAEEAFKAANEVAVTMSAAGAVDRGRRRASRSAAVDGRRAWRSVSQSVLPRSNTATTRTCVRTLAS